MQLWIDKSFVQKDTHVRSSPSLTPYHAIKLGYCECNFTFTLPFDMIGSASQSFCSQRGDLGRLQISARYRLHVPGAICICMVCMIHESFNRHPSIWCDQLVSSTLVYQLITHPNFSQSQPKRGHMPSIYRAIRAESPLRWL